VETAGGLAKQLSLSSSLPPLLLAVFLYLATLGFLLGWWAQSIQTPDMLGNLPRTAVEDALDFVMPFMPHTFGSLGAAQVQHRRGHIRT
jgi:hypothetical protein